MNINNSYLLVLAVFAGMVLSGCTGFGTREAAVEPPGPPESMETDILEAGATALQSDRPPDKLNIYLVGFHPMKDDPQSQFEAHHFCQQVNQAFMQCALYDGNTATANLTGVEYIISETLFESLPEEEKRYWHPHNGEILSGQLVAPGLLVVAEKKLMKGKLNSYGKTWHLWQAAHGTGEMEPLPFGDPKLAWSFNRFGEVKRELIEQRDQRMDIDTEARRMQRLELMPLAHPQAGVDTLKGRFEGPTEPIPGVVDKEEQE